MNNNNFPNKATVEALRKRYPIGTRIELIEMNDPFTQLVPGCKGTVQGVDDAGSLMVAWDCGSGLSVLYGIDKVRKL